ncbi:unnamed protein product [Orchesella dallaii]|uniref:Tubby C-terminal-like domain-containing protein n=1 Tax=Orchesella dallaii TaxID=48710 RepID=A0ABP1RVC7_9HEXA
MSDLNHLDQLPIYDSSEPVCATKPQFFTSEAILLTVHESCSISKLKHKYAIKSESGSWDFHCSGKLLSPFRGTKTLMDKSGIPIFKFWRRFTPMGNTFLIVDWATGRELCKFTTNPGRIINLALRVEFKDVVTERQRLLVLKGEWERKEALVFLGDPDIIHGNAKLIARISKKPGGKSSSSSTLFRNDDYIIEIAPNVDIALMVMLCIVFDTVKDNIQRVWNFPNVPIPATKLK